MAAQHANRAVARVAQVQRTWEREIERLLLRLDTATGTDELERTREALATATTVRRQAAAILERERATIRSILEEGVIESAEAQAAKTDLGDFTPDQLSALEAVIAGADQEIAGLVSDASDSLGEAVTLAINTGAPLTELVETVRQEIGTTTVRAQAAVDAAVMGAGRLVTYSSAEEANAAAGEGVLGLELVGPLDSKTRDFCRQIMDRGPLTIEQVDELDNGTDLPANVFAGGYGCRHTWAPVPIGEEE